MTDVDLTTIIEHEKNLQVGQAVRVRWTAGSFGHYQAEGKVQKINACSVRVTIDEAITTEFGSYPVGHSIVVPLITAKGNRWACFNRCEPAGGYPRPPKAGAKCPHGAYWYAEVESENPDYPVGTLSIDCAACDTATPHRLRIPRAA